MLDDFANRSWISGPEVVAEWRASRQELDEQIAARNKEIAQLREQMAKAAQARQEREAQKTRDKEARKAYTCAVRSVRDTLKTWATLWN